MNEIEIDVDRDLLNSPAIGYSLVGETDGFTNSRVRDVEIIRVNHGERFGNSSPAQQGHPKPDISGFGIAVLAGCLIGFLMHMLVVREERKRT